MGERSQEVLGLDLCLWRRREEEWTVPEPDLPRALR